MSVGGEVTTYTLDYAGGGRVVLEEGGAFAKTKHYLYGLECIGELVNADEPDSEWRYYHQDGNHLVRQTTNVQATVTLAWTYSPEGAIVLGEEGPVTHLGCEGNTTYDFSTGLIFKNGKYFDPNTGIWLTMGGMVVWNSWQTRPENRRQRKRSKKWLLLLLLFLIVLVLAGCAPIPSPTPTATPCPTPSPIPGLPSNTPVSPTGTPVAPNTPTPRPTDRPPTALPTAIIVFGGSDGQNIRNNGPDPVEQIPVWNEIGTLVIPYRGSKISQANDVPIDQYKNTNLILIGYSSGADAALIFADKYYRQQTTNHYSGKITDMALLATTMTDDAAYIDSEWTNILDRLLIWGTDIYILEDSAHYGDKPKSYQTPTGATGTFKFDSRPTQGHWQAEHMETPPRPGTGTNNSLEFRSYVMGWLRDN
jgi:hypothetical protein